MCRHMADSRNDLSEGKVRGGQVQRRPNSLRSNSLACLRSGRLSGRQGAGNMAVETRNAGDGVTTLCVTCGDNVGVVNKVSSALSGLDVLITSATCITKKNGYLPHPRYLPIEKFEIVSSETRQELLQSQHAFLQEVVMNALEGNTGPAQLAGRPSTTERNTTELISMDFSNQSDAFATVFHLTCQSSPSLLKDVSFRLLQLDLCIDSFASRATDENRNISLHRFLLTDVQLRKLDRLTVKMVEGVVRDLFVSQSPEHSHRAISISRSHSDGQILTDKRLCLLPTSLSGNFSVLRPKSYERQTTTDSALSISLDCKASCMTLDSAHSSQRQSMESISPASSCGQIEELISSAYDPVKVEQVEQTALQKGVSGKQGAGGRREVSMSSAASLQLKAKGRVSFVAINAVGFLAGYLLGKK